MRTTSNQSGLTVSEVLDIRSLASDTDDNGVRVHNDADLAREFGVSRKAIYNIRNRYTWNHVPKPAPINGYADYTAYPDGRIFSEGRGQFIRAIERRTGPVVRIRTSSGTRKTVPVSTIIANTFGTKLAS